MLLRLRPLSRAVLLSQSARTLYGGIWRLLALGCGAARSRPPALGAGLGSVGGAMSVCAKPTCGTHTPPWSGWLALNHQIHASTRSSAICVPGVTSAWSCRTKMSVVAACGRGTTAKNGGLPPVRSRACWGGCRRPPSVLRRQRGPCSSVVVVSGVGGAWSPGPRPVWCQPGTGALGWCQGVPPLRSPWKAPVAGASNRTPPGAVSHPISDGQRSL